MTADDLTRLRAVAAAATPGPWETEYEVVTGGTEQPDPCWLITSEAAKFGYIGEFFSENNAHFIATFDPPTVAALIDRVERAERERDDWQRTAEWIGKKFSALTREQIQRNIDDLRRLLTEGADDGQ